MFGDDYARRWPGVVAALDRFASEHVLRLEIDRPTRLLREPTQALEHAG